jgi:hypothetical protein
MTRPFPHRPAPPRRRRVYPAHLLGFAFGLALSFALIEYGRQHPSSDLPPLPITSYPGP